MKNVIEIWKDIPDYQGCYQASNIGRVKSLARIIKHSTGSLMFKKERILKPGLITGGYRVVNLCKLGEQHLFKISQLVAMAFMGHIPNGFKTVVDHINNILVDDRLENLQLITNRENSSKDKSNGTSKYIGVSWYKVTKKWRANICVNGKTEHLGYFINEFDASNAYKNRLKLKI